MDHAYELDSFVVVCRFSCLRRFNLVIADILLEFATSQRENKHFRIIEMECLRKRKVDT
jgi:hypothetical protein